MGSRQTVGLYVLLLEVNRVKVVDSGQGQGRVDLMLRLKVNKEDPPSHAPHDPVEIGQTDQGHKYRYCSLGVHTQREEVGDGEGGGDSKHRDLLPCLDELQQVFALGVGVHQFPVLLVVTLHVGHQGRHHHVFLSGGQFRVIHNTQMKLGSLIMLHDSFSWNFITVMPSRDRSSRFRVIQQFYVTTGAILYEPRSGWRVQYGLCKNFWYVSQHDLNLKVQKQEAISLLKL